MASSDYDITLSVQSSTVFCSRLLKKKMKLLSVALVKWSYEIKNATQKPSWLEWSRITVSALLSERLIHKWHRTPSQIKFQTEVTQHGKW